MKCRFCQTPLEHEFIDLGNAPPSNAFLTEEQLNMPETFFPLKLFVCHKCFLVQIDEYKASEEIFDNDYVYFSSFSSTWLAHARNYADMITKRLGLNADSHVVEVASNDGYLLQYFVEKQIPCLGVEPTEGTAAAAREKGVPVLCEFFGESLARDLKDQGKQADLLLGNNVLAHVPDINDFVEGLRIALKDSGTITMEFPHLMQLVAQNQFDTIYHEHFSYLSFYTVREIFKAHGLVLYDVEELPTHGGSLRIYAGHEGAGHSISENVEKLLAREEAEGMRTLKYYTRLPKAAENIKLDLLEFLVQAKKQGKKVAAYGAAAKGNTLLNFCGVKSDLIAFAADASPYKQGKFLPASHIPVAAPSFIREEKPDYLIVLPWNLAAEIMEQEKGIQAWGGRFVLPIPQVKVV
ncbi:Methyltransferase domain-containing protein [Desulfatibacillum alkenivorans DSM 16219]|jgi:hypothetical protein|uniref:Methyltransferase domain-containing protein n=1 Tax=Desulfatibacillum alkenivorans DSM 16219 TaxID=1121393 RepID=A0A1M6RX08_9BACT|nr:class I SAM-dependent methyltransferase [Desulfatibacillum alkenivorans]SHK36970.1 Methyltransferase domain-containing protein [Desulfatibacillum alkenivorans DSM 16219]